MTTNYWYNDSNIQCFDAKVFSSSLGKPAADTVFLPEDRCDGGLVPKPVFVIAASEASTMGSGQSLDRVAPHYFLLSLLCIV